MNDQERENYQRIVKELEARLVSPVHRWRCACGWCGTPAQMAVNNDLRTCPQCGGSGGLILDAAAPRKSIVAEILKGTCGIGLMDCSLADFVRGVKCFIDEESQSVRCDTHLINLLRRAACLAWEHEQLFNSQLTVTSAQPSLSDAINLGGYYKCTSVAPEEQSDELVDEVQHRMDQVVEAAVGWYQAGREGGEWIDKADALSAAIDSLLELRDTATPETDNRPSCWHCGVILAYAPKLRCEDCPTECDVEGCDEFGCVSESS